MKNKEATLLNIVVGLFFFLFILSGIFFLYLIVPAILWGLFALLGVNIGFWTVVFCVFIFDIIFSLVRAVLS